MPKTTKKVSHAKRPRLLRALNARGQRVVRPHMFAMGELAWASNYCLHFFNLLYRVLFDHEDINIAVRTWHLQTSDQRQLDLVAAAVAGNRRVPNPIKQEIEWAVKRAQNLAKNRNDAIHGTTVISVRYKIIPAVTNNLPNRFERLSGYKSMIREFRKATGDFMALAGYVFFLWNAVMSGGTSPLPKRPKLRSVPN